MVYIGVRMTAFNFIIIISLIGFAVGLIGSIKERIKIKEMWRSTVIEIRKIDGEEFKRTFNQRDFDLDNEYWEFKK